MKRMDDARTRHGRLTHYKIIDHRLWGWLVEPIDDLPIYFIRNLDVE